MTKQTKHRMANWATSDRERAEEEEMKCNEENYKPTTSQSLRLGATNRQSIVPTDSAGEGGKSLAQWMHKSKTMEASECACLQPSLSVCVSSSKHGSFSTVEQWRPWLWFWVVMAECGRLMGDADNKQINVCDAAPL